MIFSGWGPRGYGKLIVISHPGNLFTVYAHASKLLVKKGQEVYRGQAIGKIGTTGRSTGPHLHFEIRKYKKAINPQKFLARR